jgi:hypothetical protein
MKPWQFLVLGLALSVTAGCRTDPAIALLERDNYRKEQEIRRLKWRLEDLQDTVNSCPEGSASRDRTSEDREPRAGSRRNHHDSSSMRPPETERGTPTNGVPDAIRNPGVTLPLDIPEVPEGIRGPTPNGSSDEGPMFEREAGRFSSSRAHASMAAGSGAIPFSPKGQSRHVASITLDRALTGGISSGDNSGDRGLLVVVVPRDAAGRIIDAPAEMNVAVLDPALPGEAARVARWNFTAAETASLFCRTSSGPAIHLAMGWPDNPPKHNKLHVYVRYITADGRQLEANQPIEIALPGDRVARWTPADPSRSADVPMEREPAPDSWRHSETPTARTPGPEPRMASRSADPAPDRPVWSPERR